MMTTWCMWACALEFLVFYFNVKTHDIWKGNVTIKVYSIRTLLHGGGNDQIVSSVSSLQTWADNTCFHMKRSIRINPWNVSEIQSVSSLILVTQDHHANSDHSTRQKMIIDEHRITVRCWPTPHLKLLLGYRRPTFLSMFHKVLLNCNQLLTNMYMLQTHITALKFCVHLYIEDWKMWVVREHLKTMVASLHGWISAHLNSCACLQEWWFFTWTTLTFVITRPGKQCPSVYDDSLSELPWPL